MAKKTDNFLNYIPMRNPHFTWRCKSENNRIEVSVPNTGFFNRIAQLFFHRPKVSRIELDDIGSFLWQQIDGTHTVGQLADALQAEFGEQVQPLYDRIVQYLRTLQGLRFIYYPKRKDSETK